MIIFPLSFLADSSSVHSPLFVCTYIGEDKRAEAKAFKGRRGSREGGNVSLLLYIDNSKLLYLISIDMVAMTSK